MTSRISGSDTSTGTAAPPYLPISMYDEQLASNANTIFSSLHIKLSMGDSFVDFEGATHGKGIVVVVDGYR